MDYAREPHEPIRGGVDLSTVISSLVAALIAVGLFFLAFMRQFGKLEGRVESLEAIFQTIQGELAEISKSLTAVRGDISEAKDSLRQEFAGDINHLHGQLVLGVEGLDKEISGVAGTVTQAELHLTERIARTEGSLGERIARIEGMLDERRSQEA